LSDSSFSNIALAGARFSNVNLKNSSIVDAAIDGMRINGVLVTDLFIAYGQHKGG
jgi:uncharacterized protein YjbI with pentapeptide repeats